MSGISRLFKPTNDKSILRNLISEPQEYDKIQSRQLSVIKKTELADLKKKIDNFVARWNFKGMSCLWNPIFLAEFLHIKEEEAKQTPGQKVFLTCWLHPCLLSIRCNLYCPANGYKGADLDIMSKAIDKIKNSIEMINGNGLQGLATATDKFFVPDSFFPDH